MPEANQQRPLTFEDLRRFEETLKPPFRRALDSGRVDLLPPPRPRADSDDPLARAVARGRAVFDERGGRLVIPILSGGGCLGLVVVYDVSAEQLVPQVSGFLSALVEAALEMVRLRLAAETDPVTGLANESSFEDALTLALSKLSPAKVRGRPALDRDQPEGGISLLALKPEGMSSLLDHYGRIFGNRVLAEVARQMREVAPEGSLCGRAGEAFLMLLPGGAVLVQETASRLRRALRGLELATPDGRTWNARLRLGAATVDAQSWEGGSLPAEAAAVFRAHALRALDCAARTGMDEVLFYGEILDKAGRLREIMPLDRVLIDLGRVHGLGEGERFQVVAAESGGSPARAKAEIVVVQVGEEESVAELAALDDPTWSPRPGDRLRRLGQQSLSREEEDREETVTVGRRRVRVLLDEVTGLASHRSLMALFSALCADSERFAAVLVRVEGLEGMRQVMGRVGVDSLMKGLAAEARQVFREQDVLGRYAPDTLAVLMPQAGVEEARDLARELLQRLGQTTERAQRAGVAAHPCPGFAATDTLDNAAKALVHAGFLEAGSVVIFDAVSLNISGDALYAQGRISEAVAEYERALLLSPQETNVLNSLGVCFGHLGQMDRALEYFERALKAAPDDYMAHYNLGYALMAKGRLAEARSRLEKSLELRPDHADTLFQLGRLAQGEGHLEQALELMSRAARQDDCRPAVHRHLGELLAAAGKPDQAEEAFKKAVKVNSNDAAALAGLAELYLARQANHEIALSLARRARELEPGAARHLRVMAQALVGLERLDEARELLEEAVEHHQQDPFLALALARVLRDQGRAQAARDQYVRALGLEPNLEDAKQELAELEED